MLNANHSPNRAALPKILANTRVLFSAPLPGSLNSILKAVRKHNLEGVIAKRLDSIYEPGRRSLTWQKLPLKAKRDFVIDRYRPEGSTLELILVGYYNARTGQKDTLFHSRSRKNCVLTPSMA